MILAGDVGGTNARLALFESNGADVTMRAQQDYRTRDYQSLETVIAEFLRRNPGPVEAACFGVAGPVLNNKVTATNLAWIIDGALVAKGLQLEVALLVNDLVAYGYGALAMKPEELIVLHAGSPAEGNRALIAAQSASGKADISPSSGWTTRARNLPTASAQAGFKPSRSGNGFCGSIRATGKLAISAAVIVRSLAASARYSVSCRFTAVSARASNAATRHRAK